MVIAIVQARMGSTRFPGKVMRSVCGIPLIELLLRRLSAATLVDQVVVATSTDPRNTPLVEYVKGMGFDCVQGSEDDVLERYVHAAEAYGADYVVRITGDCPLVDGRLVDACIKQFLEEGVDYLSNIDPPTFPDGLDVEVMSLQALQRAYAESEKPFDHEHVTPYIRESGHFRTTGLQHSIDLSDRRWTVDEAADMEVIEAVFSQFAPAIDFGWQEVISLQNREPELFEANQSIGRNTGALMGSGQKLWKRAKRVIPGGNMLLSKRSEMFLPDYWPSYFSRSSGCSVWDLDGKEYLDMSIMGIGTNILGYGHPEVDDAVRQVVSAGNMSTLNCPEEVYLAEKLVELHPWADMVRFARTGGEANAVAIRIARAATGKDNVAICGYHGWHDWYLSANLADDQHLDGHLLPGLEPKGVPRHLSGTVFPFAYNDYEFLENLVNSKNIGVIKMEVVRNMGPEAGFLERVRKLATEKNIVLIFDECTSGFRETAGGIHKKYGVEPDMAMFGKAMGNGYAITAVVGRRDIMEAAQSTFISSTFWTERIGPAAALKTIQVMERERSWDIITETGTEIRQQWLRLAESHGLQVTVWGIPALSGFTIVSDQFMAYKTLITQEMLAAGILAANSVYVSVAHKPEHVERYMATLESVFSIIEGCENGKTDVYKLLKGPVCHSGFKRLN